MKLVRRLCAIVKICLPYFLILSVVFALIFYPKPQGDKRSVTVVRIWNVDTFEGGKGSRASFLKWVAKRVEKKRAGTHYLVSSVTLEGAKNAFQEGNLPDMLSFGVGLWEFAEQMRPISYEFCGGELQGKSLAYPWCRGGYALFCLENDFEKQGETVISVGGKNLTEVSAYLHGITGVVEEATTAYAKFLKGKYRYLLGTQRDFNRFVARGVEVFYKPLSAFCDLYQYVGVLSMGKKEACVEFLEELLSTEAQGELSRIGMYSFVSADAFLGEKIQSTVGVFSSESALCDLLTKVRQGESVKNLKIFLKNI